MQLKPRDYCKPISWEWHANFMRQRASKRIYDCGRNMWTCELSSHFKFIWKSSFMCCDSPYSFRLSSQTKRANLMRYEERNKLRWCCRCVFRSVSISICMRVHNKHKWWTTLPRLKWVEKINVIEFFSLRSTVSMCWIAVDYISILCGFFSQHVFRCFFFVSLEHSLVSQTLLNDDRQKYFIHTLELSTPTVFNIETLIKLVALAYTM